MAWRLTIDWNFISPALRIASGIATLEKFERGNAVSPPIKKFQWKIKKEHGTYGQEGFIPNLTETNEDIIKTITQSYFDGLCMKDSSFHWFFDERILKMPKDEDYMI
jgi:hypothetical protein